MNQLALPRIRVLSAALLGLALGGATLAALAQQSSVAPVVASPDNVDAAPAASTPEEATVPRRRPIGDATHDLLALQREGQRASSTRRPIPGDVANLSYERYLKSFTHEIPADFKSSVKQQESRGR